MKTLPLLILLSMVPGISHANQSQTGFAQQGVLTVAGGAGVAFADRGATGANGARATASIADAQLRATASLGYFIVDGLELYGGLQTSNTHASTNATGVTRAESTSGVAGTLVGTINPDIGSITNTDLPPATLIYDAIFVTGLVISSSGANWDLTVNYRVA